MSDSQRPEDQDPQGTGSVPPPPPPAPPLPPVPPMPPAPTGNAAPAPPAAQTEVMPAFAAAPQAPFAAAPEPARKPKKAKKQKAPRGPKPTADPGGKRRRRGLGWLIGGGITVVVLAILGVGGWFAYTWLSDTRFSPATAAEAYYDKITSGDVDGALKVWDPSEDDDPAIAATGGAFDLARAGGAEIEMDDADTYGHRSSIEATFTVDGLEYRQEISMRYSEREWLVFPKWEVDEIASSYTADALATEYLQHLVDGRATAAFEMISTDMEGDRTLIDDEIYEASQTRPDSFEITDSDVEEQQGRVWAAYTMGGEEYEAEFAFTSSVETDDGYGVWVMDSAPINHAVLWNVADVTSVNGVEVDLSAAGCDACDATALLETASGYGAHDYALVLPGTYLFAAPKSTGAVTYGDDQTLTAAPGTSSVSPAPYDGEWFESTYGYADEYSVEMLQSVVSFDARLGDEAQKQAVDAVWKQISLCMESDQFQPKNCPNTLEYSDPGYYAVSDIARSWAVKPDVFYDPATSSVVVSGGEMKVDYTWRFFEDDPWEPDEETVYTPFGYDDLHLPVTAGDDGGVKVDLSQL